MLLNATTFSLLVNNGGFSPPGKSHAIAIKALAVKTMPMETICFEENPQRFWLLLPLPTLERDDNMSNHKRAVIVVVVVVVVVVIVVVVIVVCSCSRRVGRVFLILKQLNH